MKKLALLFLLLPFFQQTDAQIAFEDLDYKFAFKIVPNGYNSVIQCAIVRYNYDGKLEVKYLSPEQWSRQMLGYEKSDANPDRINLVDSFGIFVTPDSIQKLNKSDIYDDVQMAREFSSFRLANVLKNTWRLRYKRHPFHTDYNLNVDVVETAEGNNRNVMNQAGVGMDNSAVVRKKQKKEDWRFKGWAAHPDDDMISVPSDEQMKILRQYGIKEVNEFITGDQAIRLLKDMMNSDWQKAYMDSQNAASMNSLLDDSWNEHKVGNE